MSDECECEEVKCTPAGAIWLATFADLMSLLMCFFVLLLSFSEIEVAKFKQVAGSMKKAFGVQREVKAAESPMGTSIIAQEFSPGKPQPTPSMDVKQSTSVEQPYLDVRKDEDKEKDSPKDKDGKQDQEGKGESTPPTPTEEQVIEHLKALQHKAAIKMAQQLSQQLAKESRQGLVEIETEEDRVIVRIKEKGSFPSGEAELKPEFYPTMERITEELAKTPGLITVAGHTDDIPIRTARFRSNWELSTGRAVSVLEFMASSKMLDTTQMEVTGYGDTKPLHPNTSAENRALNRRVEIKITPFVRSFK